jgi:hypothetical protein
MLVTGSPCLTKALYNRAVKDVLAREFEEKAAFIKESHLFSNWAPRYKKQLAMALYKWYIQI